jgi:copper chaperone CopZ
MAASFRNLPGAKDAVVEYPSGKTSVTFDPAKVSVDQLAALVREAGYQFLP